MVIRKILPAILTVSLFLLGAVCAYAEDGLTASVTGENTSGIFTSDVKIQYTAAAETGIESVRLVKGEETVVISEKEMKDDYENATEAEGAFELPASYLSSIAAKDGSVHLAVIAKCTGEEDTEEQNKEIKKEIEFETDISEPKAEVTGAEEGTLYKEPQKLTFTATSESAFTAKAEIKKDGEIVKTITEEVNGAEYTCEGDGVWEAKVTVNTKTKTKEAALKFTIDGTAPECKDIELSGTLSEEGWYAGPVTVSGRITDNLSGVKDRKLSVNGQDMTDKTDLKDDQFTLTLSEEDITALGATEFTVQIDAEDRAGNTVSERKSFLADVTAPQVSLTGAKEGEITNGSPVIRVAGTDNSGLEKVSLKVSRNGEALTPVEETGAITYTVAKDGAYEFTASSKDPAGNVSEEKTLRFTRDTVAPSGLAIKVSGHRNEGYDWYDSSVKADGSATDDFSGIASMEISVNGVETAQKAFKDSAMAHDLSSELTKAWFTEHESEDGKYEITMTVKDNAGNTASAKESFFADVKAPALAISGVRNGEFTQENPVIEGKVTDNYAAKSKTVYTIIRNEEKESTKEETGKETQVRSSGKDGKYTVTAYAVDRAGNRSEEQTLRFTIDTAAPVDLRLAPSGHKKKDYAWFDTSVLLSSAAEDELSGIARLSLSVNGLMVGQKAFTGGDLSEQLASELERAWFTKNESEDGKYEVVLTAADRAGNTASKEAVFYADVKTPRLAISGIKNGTFTQKSPDIKGEVTDNYAGKNTVTYLTYRDGKLVSKKVKNGAETEIEGFKKDGDYTVKAYCTDKAGNRSRTHSLTFTRDTIAPSLSVTGAKEGSFNAKTVNLGVQIRERNYRNTDVKTSLTRTLKNRGSGLSYSITPKSADYKTSKALGDTGTYKFSVYAVDKAGNRSKTHTLSFTVDRVKPEVKIKAPAAQNGYNNVVAPILTYSDDYYKDCSIKLSKDGGAPQSIRFRDSKTKDGGKRTYADFAKVDVNDGVYTLSITAQDKAGNTASSSATFKVNRFGSSFKVSKNAGQYNKKYVNKIEDPIVVTEKNLTGLVEHNARLVRDGTPVEDSVSVKKSQSGGYYIYKYKVAPEAFSADGVYEISVSSKDSVGNLSEFKTGDNTFKTFVDVTPPSVAVTGVTEGEVHDIGTEASVRVSDNLGIKQYSIMFGRDVLYTSGVGDAGLTSEKTVQLPEGIGKDLSVHVTDKAGNEYTKTVKNITVSSSPAAGALGHIGLIAGAALTAALAAAAAIFLKRRKKSAARG